MCRSPINIDRDPSGASRTSGRLADRPPALYFPPTRRIAKSVSDIANSEADPFARSSRITHSPPQAVADEAAAFAKSSRVARSPVRSTSASGSISSPELAAGIPGFSPLTRPLAPVIYPWLNHLGERLSLSVLADSSIASCSTDATVPSCSGESAEEESEEGSDSEQTVRSVGSTVEDASDPLVAVSDPDGLLNPLLSPGFSPLEPLPPPDLSVPPDSNPPPELVPPELIAPPEPRSVAINLRCTAHPVSAEADFLLELAPYALRCLTRKGKSSRLNFLR